MRKYKHHILYITAISILSLIYVNNISALSYSSNIGIGFTFNPTLSLSLSSSDLIISNLTPGSSENSNSINVSVATNAAYGYTLLANVSSDYLTHSNNTNTFSSIATDANLENLATDNTWGYSTSLDNGSSWSNYNGLSSSSSTTLLDTNTNNTLNNGIDSVDFKIAAKAGGTQPSGIYTNTINFTVVSKPIPVTLLDAFIAYNAKQYNGYYTMQSMTSEICSLAEEGSELQLLDIRDNKLYWVTKLKDGNCWMTQNLDLDLSHEVALTSENTDLNDAISSAYQDGYAVNEDKTITWVPERDTIAYNNLNSTTWQNDNNHPYSYNYLDNNGGPVYPDSLATKEIAGNHGLSGNYYNWSAAIASNNTNTLTASTMNNIVNNPKNSICPKYWRLPTISNDSGTTGNTTNEFNRINQLYNNASTNNSSNLMSSPVWFIRSSRIIGNTIYDAGNSGSYWSSTINNGSNAGSLYFNSTYVDPISASVRARGFSIRCLAR